MYVRWKKFKEVALIPGKVCHNYSSKKPLRLQVLLHSNGAVVCGHCTCMAGQGETCSHVGAILYCLGIHVCIGKETTYTCISKENNWIMPIAAKDIPFLMLREKAKEQKEKKPAILSIIPPHNEEFV